MILNQALEALKNGNEEEAWKIAQQDEGLLPHVTKEQWIEFAYKAIERREQEERMWKNARYVD